MISKAVIGLLAAASMVLVAVSAGPTLTAFAQNRQPQKCQLGTAEGFCKKPSHCEPINSFRAEKSGNYGCKSGMVCCTVEPENQVCQQLHSKAALPNAAEGCCGIESRSAAALLDYDDRILNGRKSGQYQLPWLVRLLREIRGTWKERVPSCSGVLVGRRHVLTAEHCARAGVNKILEVWLGCPENLNSPERCNLTRQVCLADKHETNGIVVLTLNEPVPYTDLIRPICLPTEEVTTAGLQLLVAGWGKTRNSSNDSRSIDKLYTRVPFVPRDQCNMMLQNNSINYNVKARYLCAGGDDTGRDACVGDSGGPLVRELDSGHQLVGLVRGQMMRKGTHLTCGWPGVPKEYVDVFAVRDWIESTIRKSERTLESGSCRLRSTAPP